VGRSVGTSRLLSTLACAALGAVGFAPSARAESARPEFENILLGAVLDFGFGSSAAGQTLLGDLGGEYTGVRTFRDRAWLVEWDALLAARGGMLGNTHPYIGLAGIRALAYAEPGYRWLPERRVSPYTGLRAGGELVVMTQPGTAISDLDRLNSVDGVAGVVARGAFRIDVGVSLLDGERSLVLVGLFQESLRAPGIYSPGMTFAEGGVAARFDWSRRLTATFEVLAGQSPTRSNAALGTGVQTTIVELALLVRFVFKNGVWLQGSGGYALESERRTYQGSPQIYETVSAPTFSAVIGCGVSLDRKRWGKR
jgi:hypothetical protein